jgi:hypothetical protein
MHGRHERRISAALHQIDLLKISNNREDDSIEKWKWVVSMLEKATVEINSSDESVEVQERAFEYRIHFHNWRHPKVTKILRHLDHVFNSSKSTQGSSATIRKACDPPILTSRKPANGLPACFYDEDWLRTQSEVLGIKVQRKEWLWLEVEFPDISLQTAVHGSGTSVSDRGCKTMR